MVVVIKGPDEGLRLAIGPRHAQDAGTAADPRPVEHQPLRQGLAAETVGGGAGSGVDARVLHVQRIAVASDQQFMIDLGRQHVDGGGTARRG